MGKSPMLQSSPSLIAVNASSGNDKNPGSVAAPLRSITKAVQLSQVGTLIQLAIGTYTVATGETFPIVLPMGVTLQGDESSLGNGIVIMGSGRYASPSVGSQNITLRLENGAQLKGLTVTNREDQGTGVWVETDSPTIANCTFTQNQRDGVFVAGTGRPLVTDCIFVGNGVNGLTIGRDAKGEYRNNTCQNTGIGIAIGNNAAPLLVNNRLIENRSGIVMTQACRPVLRGNVIELNTESGVVVRETALPDLGNAQDPGENLIRDNVKRDLQNATQPPMTLISVGNQLNPVTVDGTVEFVVNEVPPPDPIERRPVEPAPVVPLPAPAPAPVPVPAPPLQPPAPLPIVAPQPAPSPIVAPTGSALPDIRNHWAEGFIQALVGRGILAGFPDGMFKPEAGVTRAQYAVMVAKTYDLPLIRPANNFADVPPDFWGLAAIAKAFQMGFLTGFPDRSFRPGQNLTRVQAILSLVNGLQLKGGQAAILNLYVDRVQVPGYAIDAVATATQRRMIVNHPNLRLLNPLRDITRAEVSALIYQSLVSINRATAIVSPDIVQPDVSTLNFTDLATHWSKDFVLPLAAQNLVRGYADGAFKPDLGMSRVQFAVTVARSFNPVAQRSARQFNDVPHDFWAKAAIDQAYCGNFLSAFPDGSFRGDASMTRLELVQALVNGLGLKAGNPALLNGLADRASIPANAQGQVAAAIGAKLLVNFPDRRQFKPMQVASRGDVAAMVYQAMRIANRVAAVNSAYIVQ